jgi:hypothetical protein
VILSRIETLVFERNKINAAKISARNAVLAAEVHARGDIVSLLIPKQMRKVQDTRRVMCRVINHSTEGYQLNTEYGLIQERRPYTDLNSSNLGLPSIPMLTPIEAKKTKKVSLPDIVRLMRAARAGSRKRTRAQVEEEEEEERESEQDLSGEGSSLEALPPLSRRRRVEFAPIARRVNTRRGRSDTEDEIEVEVPGSSPSTRAARGGSARRGGAGGNSSRGGGKKGLRSQMRR